MSFVERQIDLTIEYYKTGKTMALKGHRVQLSLLAMPSEAGGKLSMRVYGLPLSAINELLAISNVANAAIGRNILHVDAGDAGKPLSRIFTGGILHSWGDFTQQPDVNLVIEASVQADAGLTVVQPFSYKGSIPVATVMQGFAKQEGWAFLNNGVTGMMRNPVFNGGLKDQYASCAQHAGIGCVVVAGTMVIYPKGAPVNSVGSDTMPILSPKSGMVGYPAVTNQGINLRAIFLPGMYPSSPFEIRDSQIPTANRVWFASKVTHLLDSQTPGGSWFTDLESFTPT
jgi:hypothetical protein